MDREPRFEIVGTEAGHHARFVAANGEVVWTTEVYQSRVNAGRAIELILGMSDHAHIEVRDVDERD